MTRKKNISFRNAIQLSIWPDSAICHSCQNGFGNMFMGEVLLKTQSFCLRTTIEYSCIPVIQTQYTNKMLQIYNIGTEYSRQWIDGLVQYCSISIANTLEILQFCTKPSKYSIVQCNTTWHWQRLNMGYNIKLKKTSHILSSLTSSYEPSTDSSA